MGIALNVDGRNECAKTSLAKRALPSPNEEFEYNTMNAERGYFLVFIQDEFDEDLMLDPRIGADADCDPLKEIAEKLGFEDIKQPYRNSTKAEIQDVLEQVRKEDHSNYDCFACVVLSHGGEDEDIIYAKDAKMHLSEFTEPFCAKNCPTLQGKPKLFFIQACRCSLVDRAMSEVASDSNVSGDNGDGDIGDIFHWMKSIPFDFLVANAFLPCNVTSQDQTKGSLFVQALHKCFNQYGDQLELMQIMTKVSNLMSGSFIKGGRIKQFLSISSLLRSSVNFKHKATEPLHDAHLKETIRKQERYMEKRDVTQVCAHG